MICKTYYALLLFFNLMYFPIQIQWAVQEYHGLVLGFVWVILADFLICYVRYFKHWEKYLLAHAMFTFLNLASAAAILAAVIVDSSYLFNQEGFSQMGLWTQIHFILGMIFLGAIVGLQILGFIVKFDIQNPKKLPEKTLQRKRIHKYAGYFFYGVAKIQVLTGCYIYKFQYNYRITFVLCYYVFSFIFIFLVLQKKYNRQEKQLFIEIEKTERQDKLLNYDGLMQLINNGVSKNQIILQYPNIKFVMYKDKVYDLTNFTHPGGNFIIQTLIGDQISRYLHGAYSLQTSKMLPYKHSQYAVQLLNQYHIGNIQPKSLKFFIPKIGKVSTEQSYWIIYKSISLSRQIKCIYFKSLKFKINPDPHISYLCRHFLLQPTKKNIAPRLYTLTLSMSPTHRLYVNQIIQFLKDNNKQIRTKLEQEIDELPFVIKQYKVGGFSQFIHQAEEGQHILIQGPFGRGLELEQNGHYYAFCGGTGVLPLMDFIYEILIQIVNQLKSRNTGKLPKNIKFTLYWSINNIEELVGLQLINNTYLFCKKYNMDIFNLFIRISKGESDILNIPKFENRLDENFLRKIFSNVDQGKLKKVLVCGNPTMNHQVGTILQTIVPKPKIHIL